MIRMLRVRRGVLRALLLPGVAATAGAAAAQPATLTNEFGMEFVRIEPGAMVVGRFQPTCPTPPAEGPAAVPSEGWTAEDYRLCQEMVTREATFGFPVTIGRAFYLGRYEVTQEQWQRVMGSNPSYFQGPRLEGDPSRHPVESVTWEDAQRFVARLSQLDPTATYRLPSELEWEYAARAGADGQPSWAQIRESAWIAQVDHGTTQPVGGKRPNAWGLYDMLGNVWEWVEDYYNGELFPDPVPPPSGTQRVLRGGSFISDVKNATWFTHAAGPGNGWDVGFRVVMQPTDP